jgi:hypothetical protein
MSREFEKFYDYQLSGYRAKNKDKTEIDYLNFEIEKAKLYIQENNDIEKLKNKTIESFYERNKIYEDDFPYNDALLNVETQGIINGVLKNLNYFKRSIEFHTKKLQLEKILTGFNEKEERLKNNPHPTIFVDSLSFNIFNEYLNLGLVNPYKDLSFLFQMLKSENKIYAITHLNFSKWMLKEKFITEKISDIINDKRGFDIKSQSDERLNKYNNILDKFNGFKG